MIGENALGGSFFRAITNFFPEIVSSTRPLDSHSIDVAENPPTDSARHLAAYDRTRLDAGRGKAWRAAWYFSSLLIFENGWLPCSRVKTFMLRRFGARIGDGVVIKPHVRIKFPWRLVVGDHCWIGQDVWIDNLAMIQLDDNICLSQGAYLCTGSHDHRSSEFELITRPIHIADGAWVGARAIVLPGVTIGREAVIAAGAVVNRDVEAGVLAAGNPAAIVQRDASSPRLPR